jgi:cell shape-determining protein MreC
VKTGFASWVVGIAFVAGLFWLSPRIQPFVVPARHVDRALALLSRGRAAEPPSDEGASRFAEAIRVAKARALAGVAALGSPPCAVVTVRASVAAGSPTELAVDRPGGCRFRGNEPVVCGDALVGFARADAEGPLPPIARVRLLASADTRLRGTLATTAPARVDFGLLGSPAERGLVVRLLANPDEIADGAPVTTAPDDPSVPPGLRVGRVRRPPADEPGRDVVVDPEVDASRELYLVVIGVRDDRPADRDDERFRRVDARVIAAGDAAPGRFDFALDRGSESGVVPGCAVTRGRTLVGRVLRAGPLASQAVATGDPEFRVRALALGGEEALRAFTLRGTSDLSGDALRCDAPAALAAGRDVVTALGEVDVPPGLVVGTVASASRGAVRLREGARAVPGDAVVVWISTAGPAR